MATSEDNVRYRIVTAVCRLLGHPTKRARRRRGTRVFCPCRYINLMEMKGRPS